jgi:DNA-binding transcriptional regulator YdaS (Cro superfamily)
MRTKTSLNKAIKGKFRKLSRFARLAGLDVVEVQQFFIPRSRENPELRSRIERALATMKDHATDGEIPREALRALKSEIKAYCREHKLKGLRSFCAVTEFDYPVVYQIVIGRRKLITPNVIALFKFFNIQTR